MRRADSGCEGGKSCSAWKCADEGGGNCYTMLDAGLVILEFDSGLSISLDWRQSIDVTAVYGVVLLRACHVGPGRRQAQESLDPANEVGNPEVGQKASLAEPFGEVIQPWILSSCHIVVPTISNTL